MKKNKLNAWVLKKFKDASVLFWEKNLGINQKKRTR